MLSLLPQALVPLSVIVAPKGGAQAPCRARLGGLITPAEW